jgi:NADH-quinone oxidoreductase subunit F
MTTQQLLSHSVNSEIHRLLPENPIASLDAYLAAGGGQALSKALKMAPSNIIAEVKKSGLRGRGGAGFPTGVKWASVAYDPCPTKYVACNGAEGEPGTFKDRALMRTNPYQLLEGIAITSFAVGAAKAFLAMKRSFEKEYSAVSRALHEMESRGVLGTVPIEIVRGPEDYLFGEEKALLEVIEGRDALPREADYPPYIKGLFVKLPTELNPTVANNAETLSNIPHIILHGADAYRSVGTKDSPGTMVFTISGDVERPGIIELPMGTPLRKLVEEFAGGVKPGRKVKAIFSGVASPVILPADLDTPMDFGSFRQIGSGLGSGGFIVYDDTVCMVRVAHRFSEFLFVESCGQCISCKTGTNQATTNLQQLVDGAGGDIELDFVLNGARNAPTGNRCYLPVEHSILIPSIIRNFQSEFARHFNRGCKSCRDVFVPKMADFDESKRAFTYVHTKTTEEVLGWHP